jgi:hypothetical protein
MSVQSNVSGEDLAGALRFLGVRFLLGGEQRSSGLPPVRLISALARSDEARLRLALIPLFLERPDFAVHARRAADRLSGPARLTLQCYYTAAMLLQEQHRVEIAERLGEQVLLPDLFSPELGLSDTGEPDSRLEKLARRHQALSGVTANWLGTYRHAAKTWLKGLSFAKDPA